jgi:hypothetical protein
VSRSWQDANKTDRSTLGNSFWGKSSSAIVSKLQTRASMARDMSKHNQPSLHIQTLAAK